MLKAVPNKNAGFIILLTSIFTFFFFGEIRNLTTLCLLNNNGFSLSSLFLSSLSFLWIGAQFPQEKFLSYGRILTLHYYFLLMCILFSIIKMKKIIITCPTIRSRLKKTSLDQALLSTYVQESYSYKSRNLQNRRFLNLWIDILCLVTSSYLWMCPKGMSFTFGL